MHAMLTELYTALLSTAQRSALLCPALPLVHACNRSAQYSTVHQVCVQCRLRIILFHSTLFCLDLIWTDIFCSLQFTSIVCCTVPYSDTEWYSTAKDDMLDLVHIMTCQRVIISQHHNAVKGRDGMRREGKMGVISYHDRVE